MLHESEGYKGYSYKTHLNSNTDSGILYGYKQIGITTQLLNMSHNCSLEEFNFELASLWRCDAYNIGLFGVYHSTTIKGLPWGFP